MRTFQRTLVAGAVALAVSAPAAAQFNNMFFFGDSLTDAGFYGARFTVNPGLVWAQDLGQQYGFAIKTVAQAGTDFAQGGQRVSQPSADTPPGAPQRPLTTQIDELLRVTPNLDPNTMYAVWIGANDLRAQVPGILSGQTTPAQAQANMTVAAVQTAGQLARLNAAGARNIIVLNLPDFGKTPGGQAFGPVVAAGASQLTDVFNLTLNSAIAQFGFNVMQVNVHALFNELLANPSTYGFTNVTSPACTTASAITCTTSTLVSPDAATTHSFADDIHPTPAAHAIIAQVVDSMITGPQQIAALGEAPLRVEDANYRALDGRMWSNLNSTRTQRKLEAWAAYDYGSIDMQAGPNNGSAYQNTVAVGGDMKVSDRMLAGMMFGYTENKGDFGGAGGGYKLSQPVFTMYTGYGDGPWYVGATLGAGSLDYSNVNREIVLGPSVRNESGQTRGYEYTGRLLGGYWFKYQDLLHGPYARMTYTKAVVRQFSETGSDSTALTYDQQSNEQLLWSVGWQATGTWSGIRPWARATWEYDSLDKDRSVTAASNSLAGSYSIPAQKPDNNYALFNVGAAADFGGVTGYISGSGTAARGDGNYWAVTVGLRMPL